MSDPGTQHWTTKSLPCGADILGLCMWQIKEKWVNKHPEQFQIMLSDGTRIKQGWDYFAPGFPGGARGKESACQCRRRKRHGFYPWVRKIPREGNVYPLQYSRLENSLDRGAWRATVYRVTKSQTRLKRLSVHGLCPGGGEWDLERLLNSETRKMRRSWAQEDLGKGYFRRRNSTCRGREAGTSRGQP